MSAGAFTRSKYSADYGAGTAIHPIRVQPETLLAAIGSVINVAPEGDINNPISAITSKGKRARGLRPRTVTLQFPLVSPPTGYKAGGFTVIPALTSEFYDVAITGAECIYLGAACQVVSRSAESAD